MHGGTVLVIDDSPTLLKVVELALTKGGFDVVTATDGEAGVELARKREPALVLLDFVLPKMNGYQVCTALAADKKLRDTPVVLMSSKGEQIGERLVKVMGVVDAITKPFSPEAVLTVVTHAIAKYGKVKPAPAPSLLGQAQNGEPGHADDRDEQRHRGLDTLAEELLEGLAGKGVSEAVRQELRGAMDEGLLEQALLRAMRSCPALSLQDAALVGDLRLMPLAEVLQLFGAQTHSGLLTVCRGNQRIEIALSAGRVALATAAGLSEEYLLGRFILEQNLMSKQDLELHLQSRREAGGKLIGAQLVALGYLTEPDLRQAMKQQTCGLIYEALRWTTGSFAFRTTTDLAAVAPAAVQAALDLPIDGILMEGFRRVDEWHLIERDISDFEIVFLRNDDAVAQMGRGRLTREELIVLDLVNGRNTIKDIIRSSKLGSFDVTKVLYRLLSIKLIRKRVLPVAV